MKVLGFPRVQPPSTWEESIQPERYDRQLRIGPRYGPKWDQRWQEPWKLVKELADNTRP